ncbi:MAG: phospholipase D family protein [Pseudomonadota bacterium]
MKFPRPRIRIAIAIALLTAGCATPRLDMPRPASYALPDGHSTPLGQAFAGEARAHPGLSGFQLLASGHAALVSRGALADMATKTLDLQYYSVGQDLTTHLLLERLLAAAQRGVRVRVLLDDVHPEARDFARQAIALHPSIHVRLFNPFLSTGTSTLARLGEFAVDGERLNRRMHNKLWVADNVVGIIGSRNLGDEYFDTKAAASFVDIDLLAVGPVVQQMSRAFDDYWNSAAAWPGQAFGLQATEEQRLQAQQALRGRNAACHTVPPCHWLRENGVGIALRNGQLALTWAAASLAYDPPELPKLDVPTGIAHSHAARGTGEAPGELLIVSPYLIPGDDGLEHLAGMRERGDRIAALTNSLASTDSPAAHAGYAAHRRHLLEQGVELYEIRPAPGRRHRETHRWGRASPGSLHAKFVVLDRRQVVLGSRNQDPRSRLHNTESWVTIDSPELAAELAGLFDEGTDLHHAFKLQLQDSDTGPRLIWLTEEEGVVVRHEAEPGAGFWLQLWRDLLSLLLPEHML